MQTDTLTPDNTGMGSEVKNVSTPPSSNKSISFESSSNNNMTTQSQNRTSYQQATLPTQYPITPPAQTHQAIPLSPPSPPGRRLIGGLSSHRSNVSSSHNDRNDHSPPYPPNASPPIRGSSFVEGGFYPHVVYISLEEHNLGRLLEAAPLDGAKAKGVTCVKFSPSAEFCLLGYGVRENFAARRRQNNDSTLSDEELENESCHPVTAIYIMKGGMAHVSTMMSQDDDVNIARFHPHSGHGFVYGTKQGKVRILSPKPWNYLNAGDVNI